MKGETLVLEKSFGFFEEQLQLIMVHPVSRLGNCHQPALANGLHARIFRWHRGKAFQPPEQKRG